MPSNDDFVQTTDGLIMARLRLDRVLFWPDGPASVAGIQHRYKTDPIERHMLDSWSDTVSRGGRVGVPIAYVNKKGQFLISSIRDSELILYAERFAIPEAAVPRADVPMMHFKLIHVENKDAIEAAREAYYQANPETRGCYRAGLPSENTKAMPVTPPEPETEAPKGPPVRREDIREDPATRQLRRSMT